MATTIPDSGQWSDIADTINDNFSAQETATSNLSDTVDDKADSSSLATVATTGDYNDLTNKPVLGTMAAEAAADYTPTSGLGDLATKDAVAVGDIDATGTPDNTKFLRGDMVWAAPPGGGGASWGSITGTLSDQTDLQSALDAKAASSSLATVATSGSYDDLTDKPTLGTMAAETAADYTPTASLADVATSGDYNDLINTPTPFSGSYNDLTDKPTLGTAAAADTGDFATAAQGAKADTAIQTLPLTIPASAEDGDLEATTAAVTFIMTSAFVVTAVRASVKTAPVGANIEVDINENGTSILSTVLSIDAGEKDSATAVTPAVISDSALANGAEITIDIDQVGSSTPGEGLKVYLIGYPA
jgi:hypothetical protein